MKCKIGMLAGIALLVTAGVASADTISGSWSNTSINATSTGTFLFFDSATPTSGNFSVSTTPNANNPNKGEQPENTFITVNPGTCLGSCSAATASVSVTMGAIFDGSTKLSNGFTLNGVWSGDYNSNPQTDDLIWTGVSGTGAPLATVFGAGGVVGFSFIPDQDGTNLGGLEFSFLDGSKTVDLFVLNGADWNVVTDISAGINAAAVPGPIVGAGLPGVIAGCIALFGLQRRRRAHQALGLA